MPRDPSENAPTVLFASSQLDAPRSPRQVQAALRERPADWLPVLAIFPAAELDLDATPLDEVAAGTRIELRARLSAPLGRESVPALLEAAQQYPGELMAPITAHLLSHLAA